MAKKATKLTIETLIRNYKRAGRFGAKWKKQAEEDLRFCLGDQWERDIKEQVEKQGRPALTLNIIQPNVRMVAGYQRDSRSSIRAFPEGAEDVITSEVVTKLLKNIIKKSKAENVISEAFETALTARGKAFIEPYQDYTYDLVNGTLQFNVLDGWQVRIDPNSTKYDLSDARFVTKEKKLSEEELVGLFPDKENEIETAIASLSAIPEDEGTIPGEDKLLEQDEDYPGTGQMDNQMPISDGTDIEEEKTYKFIEYYYKKYTHQYLAVDVEKGMVQLYKTEKQAKRRLLGRDKEGELTKGQRIISRRIPEIWKASVLGQVILDDGISESFPFWRGYPLIPLFGWYSAVGKRVLKREDLAYQGIASGLKDPQMEKNKRRSQSLHIINSIANRGWKSVQDAWVDPKKVEKFGSTPGVTLEYKEGKAEPKELQPAGIPHAHIYFEEKSEEDIKLISGINTDMLSIHDKTTSGRAIALRQQAGLRILKPLFDNLLWSQEIMGKYIVSQLSELYTVDKALKVLGGEFIDKNFRNTPTDTPELVLAAASDFIASILNDTDLCNYDINIGEGLESPTERYAQYSGMLDLAEKGVPIPPEVLIEYSDIPESAKKDIIQGLANAQSEQTPAPAPGK